MSYFARSVSKAPAYLSPCIRPTLGRTLSNSSDVSIASNCSGRSEEAVTSAPGTPTLEPLEQPNHHFMHSHRSDSPALLSPRAATSSSRPIAIDIPKIRKSSARPVYTPDEPVSARGDLPGGYFPLHEDPKGRVHQPHPFQYVDFKSAPTAKKASTMRPHQDPRDIPSTSFLESKATVSSHIAPGFSDYPLPVGKYYPTNYEQRAGSQLQQQHASYVSESNVSYSRSHDPTSTKVPNSDSHSRMKQYQRDMVAQTAMALSGTAKGAASLEARLTTPRKPIAPRLIPLGSPGPVTPMELEASQESYLDKASKTSFMAKENVAPSGAGYTAHSL